MDKPIFTLVEEDFQTVARERIGRELTEDEMRSAVHLFENALDWMEYAECAIDEATE